MKLAAEADAIHRYVDDLALAAAKLEDWRLADARLFAALVDATVELTELEREMCKLVKTSKPSWLWFETHASVRELVEVIDDLRVLRICVQSQIFELETDPPQLPT